MSPEKGSNDSRTPYCDHDDKQQYKCYKLLLRDTLVVTQSLCSSTLAFLPEIFDLHCDQVAFNSTTAVFEKSFRL